MKLYHLKQHFSILTSHKQLTKSRGKLNEQLKGNWIHLKGPYKKPQGTSDSMVNSLGKLPFAPMWNKEAEIWDEIENLLFQVPLSA